MSSQDSKDLLCEAPLFSFGVIADVQHADCNDAKSFTGIQRYYRHALTGLKLAVGEWNKREDLTCIVQLGDLIDGKAKATATETLARVRAVLDGRRCRTIYHIIGNHELYNLNRDELKDTGLITQAYYSFKPHPGWRFIALDGFDISTIGWPEAHPNTAAAWKMLDALNPNNCRATDGSVDWTANLHKEMKRMVPFNGAIGDEQLQWLQTELQVAIQQEEMIMILCHIPFQPGSCNNNCLLWNYPEVLNVLHTYGGRRIVAVLAGHDHDGGFATDSTGIHHITFRSPLEAPPPQSAHAIIEIHQAALHIRGFGTQESYTLPYTQPVTRVEQ
jgi:manganese-dependent ADP-ribose/CDP-alcohol diphosphatase